jgi:hypothetical protein
MAKKKRRYYFSFVRKAEIQEAGYMSVDAYNEVGAKNQAQLGLFTEFLCKKRDYSINDWEFTPVESPKNG